MCKAVNVFPICLLVALCSACLAAQDPNAQLLLPSPMSAEEYGSLPRQNKVDILSHIAESTGRLLVQVPNEGLRKSKPAIESVIATRRWLERTNDVVARMLATRLQFVVDSCVLNAIDRAEKHRLKIPLEPLFKAGSLDKHLVQNILTQNDIHEEEHIAFALSLDSTIARFCRENKYSAQDFLTGKVFDEAAKYMRLRVHDHPLPGMTEAQVKETVDVRETKHLVSLPNHIIYRGIAVKWLLPMMLDEIDNARDVRLVAALYWKHGKLAGKAEVQRGQPLRSTGLTGRLEAEGLSRQRSRIKPPRMNSSRDMARSARGRLIKRVEEEPGQYELVIVGRLSHFYSSADILPERFRGFLKQHGAGKWLELVE